MPQGLLITVLVFLTSFIEWSADFPERKVGIICKDGKKRLSLLSCPGGGVKTLSLDQSPGTLEKHEVVVSQPPGSVSLLVGGPLHSSHPPG